MRLIGSFEQEQQAYAFYSLLLKEGVENIYEPFFDEKSRQKHYRIWIYNEDDLESALDWLNRYKENPNDPQFISITTPEIKRPPPPPSPNYAEISEKEDLKWRPVRSIPIPRRRLPFTLTNFIILLCAFLFIWNDIEESRIKEEKGPFAVQIALTPLLQTMLFDLPSSYSYVQQFLDEFSVKTYKEESDLPPEAVSLLKKAEDGSSWQGIYQYFLSKKKGEEPSLFGKIRQGQFWRLFTPCLMHRGFLHILFNMIWVWILAKQIEVRLRVWKICLMMLIIGVISNVAQYLVSGPYFLGFSGIVVGMAGFIWVRQKIAPWEGYPLQKGTILFLLFFVLAMFVLELITFSLQAFSLTQLTPNIANTAHIVGGLIGMFLGRLSFFSRGVS